MTNIHEKITHVSSVDEPILDIFSKLKEPQLVHINEPEPGLFIAESPEVILRALAAGYEPVSVLMEERYIDSFDFSFMDKFNDVKFYTADIRELVKITGFNLTRGLLAAFKRKPGISVEEFLADKKHIVVLEGVVNPTNVGAIIRSAAAMFADGIVLSPDCADPLYRRASRVSMGTVFQVPWTFSTLSPQMWYENGTTIFHQNGFKLVATALKADSIPITDKSLKKSEKLAVFLGSEGSGLADSTINACDFKAIIPMSGGVDSLNVAAASAVAFWELFKPPNS